MSPQRHPAEKTEKKHRKQRVYETVEGAQLFTPAGTLRPHDRIQVALQTLEVISKVNQGPGMMELRLKTALGEQRMKVSRTALVPVVKLASPGARKTGNA